MSNRKDPTVKIAHKCTQCGRCCIQRGDISLTPLDVFRIAHFLKMSTKDFISKYCDIGEYMDVHIRARGPLDSCMFLQAQHGTTNAKAKCTIYPVRPMACYLYPLRMANGIKNMFTVDKAPFCSRSKKTVPINEFVQNKSGGRYDEDCTHIQKFSSALEIYYDNPQGKSEIEMLEYFYYNNSAKEAEKKVDDFLGI